MEGSMMVQQRKAIPSVKSQAKAAQTKGQLIPNDVGLFQGTFIPPTGNSLPSLYFEPRSRLTIETKRIKSSFQNALMLMVYKWFMRKPFTFNPKRTPSLNLITDRIGGKSGKAAQMHKEMYTAFAEENLETLRKMCGDGLLASFRARLSHRPKGEKWSWTLNSYVGTPRVVSNRAGRLPFDAGPGDRGSALRQVVVRIR
ncbi:hypothetical protein LTS18_014779, partial [Coniosporium uncinatum]